MNLFSLNILWIDDYALLVVILTLIRFILTTYLQRPRFGLRFRLRVGAKNVQNIMLRDISKRRMTHMLELHFPAVGVNGGCAISPG